MKKTFRWWLKTLLMDWGWIKRDFQVDETNDTLFMDITLPSPNRKKVMRVPLYQNRFLTFKEVQDFVGEAYTMLGKVVDYAYTEKDFIYLVRRWRGKEYRGIGVYQVMEAK